MVSPSLTRLAALTPIFRFFSTLSICCNERVLNLLRQGAEKRTAVLTVDMSVALELLEVLPDRGLRNPERNSQVANARAAFFLEPGQDLHAARFGEQPD